ncbi:Malonyl-[acyl-carrier protein] O-methyltransferase [Candidatus Kinetoplastibacterium sorsogonicusi]|uniref:Malonyl-[acyl-carrier protein] O-methyltransferase n=1 Tax=Candidatus Kinetoplastidibacterium kentomonadis TaxID=1576550 RepID=A0A3S7JAL3_9PROT|nr:methyltransferase domain-containing protein [Candidatus Kinetoplastibacterium sorsogonicusi]AWD32713.1 Malonyl-[acyl-carrier protein] O-methyltransferase [Candidatus Kinetoplastibacterium sorsogonicusi]
MNICNINKKHVILQFERRNLSNSKFLYEEIANRLAMRLKYVKINPKYILDVGCNAANNFSLLNTMFSKSSYIGLDFCKKSIERAHKIINNIDKRYFIFNFFKNIPKIQHKLILSDMASTNIENEYIDLIWSNMALHWHDNIQEVFEEWYRILKTEGIINFSCFGTNTIKELHKAIKEANIKTSYMIFNDIHTIGDTLNKSGFANIVMSQETLTFTYENPERLLKDVQGIGGNPMYNRHNGLLGKEKLRLIYESLNNQKNQSNLIPLTINIIYGYACKSKTINNSVTHKINFIS